MDTKDKKKKVAESVRASFGVSEEQPVEGQPQEPSLLQRLMSNLKSSKPLDEKITDSLKKAKKPQQ